MQGTNRPISRIVIRLLIGAFLIVALTAGSAIAKGPPRIRGGSYFVLPWQTTGTSVAVGPDGTAWFGTFAPESLSLVSVGPAGMEVTDLDPTGELVKGRTFASTNSLRFDGEGNLWFVRLVGAGLALVRRAPDGSETALDLPGGKPVDGLAIGPEGDPWMARGNRKAPEVAHLDPTGVMQTFPLPAGTSPTSIATGPDGNLWVADGGKVGRISPAGKIRLFSLGPHVEAREIVAGADGRLWFSENGRPGPRKQSSDRIGRITTAGKITQFPIPFGHETVSIAADPRGPIWFTTEKGEIASIAGDGKIGARGCAGRCSPINSLAVAPDGGLWFTAAKHEEACLECGGGSAILQQLEGAPVGEIPPGALAPPR